jgi:hypothetical protein
MKKIHGKYTVRELIENESFLRWRLFSSQEDGVFWENYQKENPDMKERIESAIRTINTIRFNLYNLPKDETDSMLGIIEDKIRKKQKRKRSLIYASISAAAAILIFFSILDPFSASKGTLPKDIVAASAIEDDHEIRIVIGNQSLTLQQDADLLVSNDGNITVSADNKEIIKKKIEEESTLLNKLIVPKGRRSSLTLVDGTKIWINSGSILEFPAAFRNDKREIKVEGEIYIEVAKDKDKPFVVNTSQIAVEVLGTRFNVSAYEDDESINVVLVEGKVEVHTGVESVLLYPDQMASITDNIIRTEKVDVYNYISWKDGLMQFSSEPLHIILTRLVRYYDKKIECDTDIRNINCTGKLVLFDNIEDVIIAISNAIPVKYTITDNIIYFSKK